MKCRSVACIWSATPPSHRVTAAAVLSDPPTLYTGAYDGSIVWWNLTVSDSSPGIKRVALLCGHAAPVTDLSICYPITLSGNGNKDSPSNDAVTSSSDSHGALISACTDGVLCVWSRSSGHCRRRRKLPPWVGSPSLVQSLPTNQRYVCIGCCSADHLHSDHHSFDLDKTEEVLVDRESSHRKSPKCTVVIVDTYTLTILQTVFHGNLSVGPLKFMAVVPPVENEDKYSVIMTDVFGGAQIVSVSMDLHTDGESEKGSPKNHNQKAELTSLVDVLDAEGPIVSTVNRGNVIAIVLKSRCIFKLMPSGALVGEILFADCLFSLEGDGTQSHVMGGSFLGNDGSRRNSEEHRATFVESFALWKDNGSGIVYSVSYLDNIFKHEAICEIPAASYPQDIKLSASFVQLDRYLLRIESVCLYYDDPLLWKPRITIWGLHTNNGNKGKNCQQPEMLGEGGLAVDWIVSSTPFNEIKDTGDGDCQSSYEHADDLIYEFVRKRQVVSSSMVISENFYTPYAVVYGFFSGDIEVVRFEMCHLLEFRGNSPRDDLDSPVSRQYFSGHKGAVLSLAAHQMLDSAKGTFKHVLVSGSVDCTVRIWDLERGSLITVMHQHVSPVRQLILPPARTEHPWSDCFLSVGEDACVALVSLETLEVERMFPGHPSYPAKVVWDGVRGYVACLCRDHHRKSDAVDVLYIWDIKTGARERVLRGAASHSMFDHFCKGINVNSVFGCILNGNTSVSSLLLPITEDGGSTHSNSDKGVAPVKHIPGHKTMTESNALRPYTAKENASNISPSMLSIFHSIKHPIKCSCPFPGVAALSFDLEALMFSSQKHEFSAEGNSKHETEQGTTTPTLQPATQGDASGSVATHSSAPKVLERVLSVEESIIRFSLSFLHLWNVDVGLDQLLVSEMKLKRPNNFVVASGLLGDKGSLTLTFPGSSAILELWKSSSEFCALRSLAVVSLAERLISLCHSGSAATSALAAFYARNFADKYPDIKPPLLQLLVSFWQDESEHVCMAARSLFHCAASRAIPRPLCNKKATDQSQLISAMIELEENESKSPIEDKSSSLPSVEESKILAWLESYEMQDWISCVGGTRQDAMTSHIIVAAALAIWYPSLVKPCLPTLVVHSLVKLVMAMNEKYSLTAAELLAEGMENTWKACIASEIPRLIGDIFFQIECVSGAAVHSSAQKPAVPASLRETLVGVLLPSLAIADVLAFLTVIERQIWSTASDSPVHSVSLKTFIRVIHGSPRNLAQYLDKAITYILHTMDPGNSVLRKTCLQSSKTALKEIVRSFPMVALNKTSTRLAVGDAIGDINNASIRVYDMHSMVNIKVLDAKGPPGLPKVPPGGSEVGVTTLISALSFSPDGEGIVAFSEHGLTIRWWSLGSPWWEKLSRTNDPVQYTKVIFVPPWEGFSPNSVRSSIIGSIMGHDNQANSEDNTRDHMDRLKLLIQNLDLSYRLEWLADREVRLTRHGHELGTFQI